MSKYIYIYKQTVESIPWSPVAEVRWDRKEILWVIHIFGQQLSIHGLIFRIKSANQNRYNFYRPPALHNITQIFAKEMKKETYSTVQIYPWNTLARYGKCISMLCSASSTWRSISSNFPVAFNSSLTGATVHQCAPKQKTDASEFVEHAIYNINLIDIFAQN